MSRIAMKFQKLKTSIGGNREANRFEYSMGMTPEEKYHVTLPGKAQARILGELEFAMRLSAASDAQFDGVVEAALDFLLGRMEKQETITSQDCGQAEEMLLPLEGEAKTYQLILVAHSHLDMNWMWGFQETVAATLATFRSVLNIMNEYPDFCYAQSQASVYKIVEEYDPDMMEEIQARIREGRWEVTASAWVETDKNMPSGESLLRHIQYAREYLSSVWGVDGLDLDFSPDTFGHSACVPEIDAFGEVKYYYHCRGNNRQEVLYRYQAPSGKQILAYREPNWYNAGVTPHMGIGLPEISRRSGGLRTGVALFGVGDHGGGPTRRDVERALDMMTWKIFPQIKFGTLHEYFHEAEKVWDRLPVVDCELNFFAPGCYTTQSRIKRGNRRCEAAMLDAEAICSAAGAWTGYPFPRQKMRQAWQDLLFTHFHDILPGSCKRESREYAMGLFQGVMATANTQLQNASCRIGNEIDTSSIPLSPGDLDVCDSLSEGAGAGYGIDHFVGVPSPERGSGRTRIFHIFNPLSWERAETVELTVWDWTGDLQRLRARDWQGRAVESQLLDHAYQHYWDHEYVRVLVKVRVPALGYTTVVLYEEDLEFYPLYLSDPDQQVKRPLGDCVLDNGLVAATIDGGSGRVTSLLDLETGQELIAAGKSAGLTYLETEKKSSDAWNIGRHILDLPVERCIAMEMVTDGPLRKGIRVSYEVEGSKMDLTYSLDRGQKAVRMDLCVDWNGSGKEGETVPVLDYRVPVSYETETFQYDIPAGVIRRQGQPIDVPALQYGMALRRGRTGAGSAQGSQGPGGFAQGSQEVGRRSGRANVLLSSDCKYGYRGWKQNLALTLINSAASPDPYPERGIHRITLWLGACGEDAAEAERMATSFNHRLFYQPSNRHPGKLPMEGGLMTVEADGAQVSAVLPAGDGSLLVRVYETAGKDSRVRLIFGSVPQSAVRVNLMGNETGEASSVCGRCVEFTVAPYSLAAVKVRLG